MDNIFNNREIATGIWLLVLTIWLGTYASIRDAVSNMLKMFFKPKIIIPVLLMAIYVALEVRLLRFLGFWDSALFKDTIYWFILTGFVLFMNFMANSETPSFLKKTVLQCFAVTVLIEFLTNLYCFPLWGELILIPIATFLGASLVITESAPEYAQVKKLFEKIQSFIGIVLLIYLVIMTWRHHSELSPKNLILSFLLPILLTILFIPFLYFAKLFADYEILFIRLSHFISDNQQLLRSTKLRTLLFCNINLPRLKRFEKVLLDNVWYIKSGNSFNHIIQRFKLQQTNSLKNISGKEELILSETYQEIQ